MSGVINGNKQCCGTCEHWTGPRRLNSISEVKWEGPNAKCSKTNAHISPEAYINCGQYKKWSQLT